MAPPPFAVLLSNDVCTIFTDALTLVPFHSGSVAKKIVLDVLMAEYKAGLVSAVDAADAPAGDVASYELSEHAQMLKTVSLWSDISVSGCKGTLQQGTWLGSPERSIILWP